MQPGRRDVHEEPSEEILGIEELVGGTFRSLVPVARHGSFQLEPFEGQGRTQQVARETLDSCSVVGADRDPILDALRASALTRRPRDARTPRAVGRQAGMSALPGVEQLQTFGCDQTLVRSKASDPCLSAVVPLALRSPADSAFARPRVKTPRPEPLSTLLI
jgi:hypothetical protein